MRLTDDAKNQLMDKYSVWEETYNNKGQLIKTSVKLPNLGELIYHELGYHFLTTYDNAEIYIYNGGTYEPKGEQIIKELVEQFLGDETKEHYKNEVYGYIRDKNYKDRGIFTTPTHLINLENGIYDIKKKKLLEHNPEYYFLQQLPIIYNKNTKIKKTKQFFKQILKTDDIKRIQEIFGYCLYRDYHIQKGFMFTGEGANGKSTTLNLLKTMLGNQNVSSVSLQELCENRFAASNLYNKLANIYPDLPDKTLTKTGMFKILTGGDNISAEQKFKDYFNFINYAKLIFSANKIPEAKDDTSAFFRRWEFINFPNTFYGEKCDPKILSKLTDDKEISGLFNWSIIGLNRLLKNGCFSYSLAVDEMREKYTRLSSPIASFVMDCLEIQPQKYVLKDDLYACFIEYCVKNSLPTLTKNVFSMKLHEHVKVNDYRPSVSGKRVQAWIGIDFCASSDMSDMSGYTSYFISQGHVQEDIKIEKHLDSLDDYDNKEGMDDS